MEIVGCSLIIIVILLPKCKFQIILREIVLLLIIQGNDKKQTIYFREQSIVKIQGNTTGRTYLHKNIRDALSHTFPYSYFICWLKGISTRCLSV